MGGGIFTVSLFPLCCIPSHQHAASRDIFVLTPVIARTALARLFCVWCGMRALVVRIYISFGGVPSRDGMSRLSASLFYLFFSIEPLLLWK